MAEVDPDAAAAADAAANDELTTTVLKIRDESFETMPWASVADIQLGYAPLNYLTPDSFVDTVVPCVCRSGPVVGTLRDVRALFASPRLMSVPPRSGMGVLRLAQGVGRRPDRPVGGPLGH